MASAKNILTGLVLLAPAAVLARTDLSGCTSTTSTVANSANPSLSSATVIYYVPGTGEICSIPDCGGGQAPPKTTPGCPAYTGTATLTPSFLPGFSLTTASTGPITVTPSAPTQANRAAQSTDVCDDDDDDDNISSSLFTAPSQTQDGDPIVTEGAFTNGTSAGAGSRGPSSSPSIVGAGRSGASSLPGAARELVGLLVGCVGGVLLL